MVPTDTTCLRGGSLRFPRTRYFRHVAIILLVLSSSWGCLLHSWIGPGYRVDIKVSNRVVPEHKDVDLMEKELIEEGFVRKTVNTSANRTCLIGFKPFAHPTNDASQIDGVSSSLCFTPAKNRLSIDDLRVNIYSDTRGQSPILKGEIDRIAEVVYRKWSDRFGKENITFKKLRTGPPF